MTLKKTLSFCLAFALILSILAPCGALKANALTTLYGEKELEQVTEPVIGESYYLAASTGEEMIYFRHGSVTETAPYSLATSRSINHNWVVKVTLEDSTLTDEKEAGYFQFTYLNPSNGNTSRIYCYDAAGKDGVMDTGANSVNYKNRHSFIVDDIDGLKVLRKIGNESVLVAKEMEFSRKVTDAEGNSTVQTGTEWRILGVPEAELANEGVHPVMLLQEHEHTYGSATVDANTASRTCTACGYVQTVYGNKLMVAEEITVGNEYYLAADVNGMMYYVRHGAASETSPYSLPALSNINHKWVVPMTFAAPTEGNTGFQINYTNPSDGRTMSIYCYDVGADGTVDTGINATPALNTHTYFVDTVGDDRVLRCLGNNYILAIQQMDVTSSGTTTVGYRMLGVPEADLANEGVYPVIVMEAHKHTIGSVVTAISDSGHKTACWCGGDTDEVAHIYGAVTADGSNHTASRACTVCGYTNVVYSNQLEQVKYPTVGGSYYMAANVDGKLNYFVWEGKVTDTAPYSPQKQCRPYFFLRD